MRHLALDAEILSDGLSCFRRFVDAGHAHTMPYPVGGASAYGVRGARSINVLLSNVNRAISGSHHAIRQS